MRSKKRESEEGGEEGREGGSHLCIDITSPDLFDPRAVELADPDLLDVFRGVTSKPEAEEVK